MSETRETAPMTPDQFAARMAAIFPDSGYDEEIAHGDADDLMCELLTSLGYSEGVRVFKAGDKWYS